MNDAGLITLASFISPYETDRNNAREIIGEEYIEIFVSTPLEDVKNVMSKVFTKKPVPEKFQTSPEFPAPMKNRKTQKLKLIQASIH